jgi:sirohydrochlorin cobaltochelatase
MAVVQCARSMLKCAGGRVQPKTIPSMPGSQELGAHLSEATGCEVIVGFNEFCAPSVDDAVSHAIARGAEKVIVVTPMMTRGGEHAEVDIPAAVKTAQAQHPEIPITYAWPFRVSEVASFLATQIAGLL